MQVDECLLCELECGGGNGATGVSGLPLPPLASPFGRGCSPLVAMLVRVFTP